MANFSSFFPVAGGGGFTKMKKITTFRSGDDATDKLLPNIALTNAGSTVYQDSNVITVTYADDQGADLTAADAFVGYTYTTGANYVHTITASGSNTGTGNSFQITTTNNTPYSNIQFNWFANSAITWTAPGININPSSDLGLEDGDSIGYMLVGSGVSSPSNDYGGQGGRIIYGTAIISSASTNLVCTPGAGNNVNSTITGGLTLSSADGIQFWGTYDNGSRTAGGSDGIFGYGAGGRDNPGNTGVAYHHGWGTGGDKVGGNVTGDGAILLYY